MYCISLYAYAHGDNSLQSEDLFFIYPHLAEEQSFFSSVQRSHWGQLELFDQQETNRHSVRSDFMNEIVLHLLFLWVSCSVSDYRRKMTLSF